MFVLWSRSERLVRRLPMDDDLVAVVAVVALVAGVPPAPRPPAPAPARDRPF